MAAAPSRACDNYIRTPSPSPSPRLVEPAPAVDSCYRMEGMNTYLARDALAAAPWVMQPEELQNPSWASQNYGTNVTWAAPQPWQEPGPYQQYHCWQAPHGPVQQSPTPAVTPYTVRSPGPASWQFAGRGAPDASTRPPLNQLAPKVPAAVTIPRLTDQLSTGSTTASEHGNPGQDAEQVAPGPAPTPSFEPAPRGSSEPLGSRQGKLNKRDEGKRQGKAIVAMLQAGGKAQQDSAKDIPQLSQVPETTARWVQKDNKYDEDQDEEEVGQDWAAIKPLPALKSSTQKAWEAAIKWRDDQVFTLSMVGRSMEDAEMSMWCSWFQSYMKPYRSWEEGFVAQEVDLSRNCLTSLGVRRLLNALWDACVSVRVLKLHHNQLECSKDIAGLMAEGVLREAHLSHNYLDASAGADLVLAAAAAWDTDADSYCYPRITKGGSPAPLWLRLEQNCIDFATFERRLKSGMKWLKRRTRSVCHVDGTKGCTPHVCMACSSPPVVHLPYMMSQRREYASEAGW